MMKFMIQFRFGPENFKALVQKPENRTDIVRQGVEAFGGRLHSLHFAYGEYDGVLMAEFPDTESCTAFLLMVASRNGVSAFKTTVLVDPDEAHRSMQRAAETRTGYRPATTTA
ncbi:GYD domain-containing protein [Azospirillum sp. sgz302134]